MNLVLINILIVLNLGGYGGMGYGMGGMMMPGGMMGDMGWLGAMHQTVGSLGQMSELLGMNAEALQVNFPLIILFFYP